MMSSSNNRIVVDLGTTSLAAQLLSAQGTVLSEAVIANPQRELAVDILQRLQLASEQGGTELQSVLVNGLRDLISALLDRGNCPPENIDAAVVAGNPGMSCLLRNLPVNDLLFPPHKPPYKDLSFVPVSEVNVGLSQPLQLFPLVSGFVGGDLVAVLLWLESLGQQGDSPLKGTVPGVCLMSLEDVQPGTLLIDIGTNAELALWDGSRWWVTSAAAGPAFEGGNISAGMIMTDGAVTDVRLDGDTLSLTVLGGGAPRGLCGSGLAALVAAAREGGLIDQVGRILSSDEVETNLGRYLVKGAGGWAIRFYHSATSELILTQEDLRSFQLAKGAVLAGVQVLLERGCFAPEDVSHVFVTGALGTSLPKEVLKRVALLPEPMLDKTSFVANGVLAGLRTFLASNDRQQRLEALLETIQPFPLSGTPAFERFFLASLEF